MIKPIRYLPIIYPDELLYSIVARYNHDCGYIDVRCTTEELFGVKTASAVYDLPSRLGYMARGLQNAQYNWDVHKIIKNHTLYFLYKDFLPKKSAKKLYNLMIAQGNGSIHSFLGICPSSLNTLKYFKYCPDCNVQSKKEYGQLYYNRIHQNIGVKVCHIHGSILCDSQIPIKNKTHPGKYIPANAGGMPQVTKVVKYSEEELRILREISLAHMNLIRGAFSLSYLQLKEKYFEFLGKRGFLRRADQVNLIKFKDDFIKFYGQRLLQEFNSNPSDNNDNWLFNSIRLKGRTVHPLRHIMLIIFLAGSYDGFCSDKSDAQSFSITQDSKDVPTQKSKKSCQRYYGEWLELRNNHPGKSRTELRKLHYNAYKWLFKHDREWMCGHMPEKARYKVENKTNWHQRDKAILSKVKLSVKDLLSETQPYIKLTIKSIGSKCEDYRTIIYGKNKLPETYAYLNSVTETTYQFKIRKINHVIARSGVTRTA